MFHYLNYNKINHWFLKKKFGVIELRVDWIVLSLVVKELLFEYRGVKNRICKKYNCYLILSRLHNTCHRRGTLIVEEDTLPKSLDHRRGKSYY